MNKTNAHPLSYGIVMWPWKESNLQPADSYSAALPFELQNQIIKHKKSTSLKVLYTMSYEYYYPMISVYAPVPCIRNHNADSLVGYTV